MHKTYENTKFFLYFSSVSNPAQLATSANSFLTSQYKKIEIAQPTGWESLDFKLQQENNRYGRDAIFSENDLTFNALVNVRGLTHEFDRLVNFYRSYGFEAKVLLGVEVSGDEKVLGQLDFENAETDELKYFTCSVIQDTLEAQVKRHLETKVDLYSSERVIGGQIDPLSPAKVLMNSLPLEQVSTWFLSSEIERQGSATGSFNIWMNWANQIENYEIEDTLSPSTDVILNNLTPENTDFSDFEMIESVNRLRNASIRISDFNANAFSQGGGTLTVRCQVWIRHGVTFDNSEIEMIDEIDFLPVDPESSTTIYNITNYDQTFQLPNIDRGEKLWLAFRFISNSANPVVFTAESGKITITATSLALSTVTDGIRLGDAMQQVVKSISGADIDAPLFLENGVFDNQYIFKGNQLRQNQDKGFKISFKEILEYLPEVNGDYQVLPNGDVKIGLQNDYYVDTKIDEFTLAPNDIFSKSINQRFALNRIEWKYGKYEKGDSGDERNSLDGIATEAQYILPNKQVESVKKIDVGFIRDAWLIEKVRKESLFDARNTKNAAKINDEDVFIIDTTEGTERQNEKLYLNATQLEIQDFNYTVFFNDGSFNFELLGLVALLDPGNGFSEIEVNNYHYRVMLIEPTKITLEFIPTFLHPLDPEFEGIDLYNFEWTPDVELKLTTDENVQSFSGTPNAFANMDWAIRRNLAVFWGTYFKTAGRYYPTGQIKNTYFVNGENVEINRYSNVNGSNGAMNDSILISQLPAAKLTDKIITTEVPCKFPKFWNLIVKLREEFGYVEIMTNKGSLAKIYPQTLEYNWELGKVLITGEEKYE